MMITFKEFLLLEGKEELIADKQNQRLLDRYSKDIASHPSVPKNLTTSLDIVKFLSIQTIPIFIIWVANQYLRGQFSLEDIGMIKQDLELFNKLKPILPEKDINRYNTLAELRQTLQQYNSQQGKKKSTLNTENKLKPLIDNGEAEIVYNSGGCLVIHTKTHKANCVIGAGTKWCTTTKDDPGIFDRYNSEGPIYVIITPDKEKYQLHNASQQFMNSLDHSIFKLLETKPCPLIKYPNLANFLFTLPESDWMNNFLDNLNEFYPKLKPLITKLKNQVKNRQEFSEDVVRLIHSDMYSFDDFYAVDGMYDDYILPYITKLNLTGDDGMWFASQFLLQMYEDSVENGDILEIPLDTLIKMFKINPKLLKNLFDSLDDWDLEIWEESRERVSKTKSFIIQQYYNMFPQK